MTLSSVHSHTSLPQSGVTRSPSTGFVVLLASFHCRRTLRCGIYSSLILGVLELTVTLTAQWWIQEAGRK